MYTTITITKSFVNDCLMSITMVNQYAMLTIDALGEQITQ